MDPMEWAEEDVLGPLDFDPRLMDHQWKWAFHFCAVMFRRFFAGLSQQLPLGGRLGTFAGLLLGTARSEMCPLSKGLSFWQMAKAVAACQTAVSR